MTVKVLALASGVTGLADHRSLEGNFAAQAGTIAVRSGVLSGTGGALSTVSAMVARIAPVRLIINNGVSDSLGPYLVVSDANVDITFDAGQPSVSRVDRIIARVRDNANDGSGSTAGSIEYLKGQSGGSATALPTNSLLLYEVTVPAGASAGGGGINFNTATTDKRVYTTANGGAIPVANDTEMSAISSPYEGMVAYRKDWDVLFIYDGTAWRPKGTIAVDTSTSLSFIENPFAGQIATARDKLDTYMYNGSAWVWVGTPVQTRVGVTTSTSDSSTVNATEAVVRSVTFSAVSGFKYRITFDGSLSTDVNGDSNNVRIREDNLAGNQLKLGQFYLPLASGNGYNVSMSTEFTAASTASKTIVLTSQRSNGTGTAHRLRASSTNPDLFIVNRVVS